MSLSLKRDCFASLAMTNSVTTPICCHCEKQTRQCNSLLMTNSVDHHILTDMAFSDTCLTRFLSHSSGPLHTTLSGVVVMTLIFCRREKQTRRYNSLAMTKTAMTLICCHYEKQTRRYNSFAMTNSVMMPICCHCEERKRRSNPILENSYYQGFRHLFWTGVKLTEK